MAPRRPKSKVPGLSAVRGPHKEDPRLWYWRFRQGASGTTTLWTGWSTKAEAERTAYAILADPESAPAAIRGAAPQTVRQLLRLWGRYQAQRRDDPLHPHGQIKPVTAQSYRSCVKRLVRDIGHIDLQALDARELRRLVARRAAPRTAKLDLTILAAAWRWGRSRGLVPQTDLALPRIDVPDKVAYTPSAGDVAAVLKHLTSRNRLAVQLMAATGARPGEILHLVWDRVDLERGMLTVEGKTGPRDVPISALEVQSLREALSWKAHPDGFVLGAAPKTMRDVDSGICKSLNQACEAAGVTPFKPQALRRLASSRLLEAGVAPLIYEHVMGHSFAIARKHYASTSEAARRDALALLALPKGEVVSHPALARMTGTSPHSDTTE
jgi:integrase